MLASTCGLPSASSEIIEMTQKDARHSPPQPPERSRKNSLATIVVSGKSLLIDSEERAISATSSAPISPPKALTHCEKPPPPLNNQWLLPFLALGSLLAVGLYGVVVYSSLATEPDIVMLGMIDDQLPLQTLSESSRVSLSAPEFVSAGQPFQFVLRSVIPLKLDKDEHGAEPEYNARLRGPDTVNIISSAVLLNVSSSPSQDLETGSEFIEHVFEAYPQQPGKYTLEIYLVFSDVWGVEDESFPLKVRKDPTHSTRRYIDRLHRGTDPLLRANFAVTGSHKSLKHCLSASPNHHLPAGHHLSDNTGMGRWKRVGNLNLGGYLSGRYSYQPIACTPPSALALPFLTQIPDGSAILFFGDSMLRNNVDAMVNHMIGIPATDPIPPVRRFVCWTLLEMPEENCTQLIQREGILVHVPVLKGMPVTASMCIPPCLDLTATPSYIALFIQNEYTGVRPTKMNITVTYISPNKPQRTVVLTYIWFNRAHLLLAPRLDEATELLGRKYDTVVFNVGLHDLSFESTTTYRAFLTERANELASYGARTLVLLTWAQNPAAKYLVVNGIFTFSASLKRTEKFNAALQSAMQEVVPQVKFIDLFHMTTPLLREECPDGVHYSGSVTMWTAAVILDSINNIAL